jgi:hypothetical protein
VKREIRRIFWLQVLFCLSHRIPGSILSFILFDFALALCHRPTGGEHQETHAVFRSCGKETSRERTPGPNDLFGIYTLSGGGAYADEGDQANNKVDL